MTCDGLIGHHWEKQLSEEEKNSKISHLRELVLGDNRLKHFRTDDAFLLRFLYCRGFDEHLAFQKLERLCELLLEQPEWFATSFTLDKVQYLQRNVKAVLKGRDRSGRNIYVYKLANIEVYKTSMQEEVQLDDIWYEMILDDKLTQAHGLCVIFDMDAFPWGLFSWLTPANIKLAIRKTASYPFSDYVVHVVNTSIVANAAIHLAWPFFTNKIKSMMKFHFANWDSMHEYVSPDVLPPEYGGTGPSINFTELAQSLFQKNSEIVSKLRHYELVLSQCSK